MADKDFTIEQNQAITAKGNILVSAAAGSGKTTVLAERIVREICDENNPLSAEKLLVVTFTNAAADEMRTRIIKNLQKAIENADNKEYLIRQKLLLHTADICTIDSFCINLLRKNFSLCGVEPDFKIADETDFDIISKQALDEVAEEYFESGKKEFYDLLKLFRPFDDGDLKEVISEIYKKSRSLPFGDEWINGIKKYVNKENFKEWFDIAFGIISREVDFALPKIQNSIEICRQYSILEEKYLPTILDCESLFDAILKAVNSKNWDAVLIALEDNTIRSLSAVRGSEYKDVAENIKNNLSSIKENIKAIKNIVYDKAENVEKESTVIYPQLNLLLEMAERYSEILKTKMKEKNVLTFAEVEETALRMICEIKDGKIVKKADADKLIADYDEVFVDEYQDVNDLQDILFSVLSDNCKHLFAVGDLKQSIYGFRGSNPENFISKKESYIPYSEAVSPEKGKKIILGANFRSRANICNFANYIFSRIMTKENTGIEYKEEENLIPKAKFPESEGAEKNAVELHFVSNSDDLSLKKAEAIHIADYIEATVNGEKIIRDKDTGLLRSAKYSDFAVLLKVAKGDTVYIAEELKKRNIPVSYAKEDFIKTKEVSFVLNLLSVIDNPERNVELLSVMMSDVFGFSADEMAKIRVNKRGISLYSSVIKAKEEGNEKCARFLETVSEYRRYSAVLPVSELLIKLYDLTDIENYVSSYTAPQIRRANLKLLLEYAVKYQTDFYGGISGFIKYINKLNIKNGGTAFGDEDAVKIMTMHKSKGLQFPICILAYTNHRISNPEKLKQYFISSEFGVSVNYFDDLGKTKTLQKIILQKLYDDAEREELLRLLYVALTRAEDKAVVICSNTNPVKSIDGFIKKLQIKNGKIDRELFLKSTCIYDFIVPAVLTHPSASKIFERTAGELDVIDSKGEFFTEFYEPQDTDRTVFALTSLPDTEIKEKIEDAINYSYKYDYLKKYEAKASVTSLAHKNEEDKYAFDVLPDFMYNSGLSPAKMGTAIHKVMQFIDFSNAKNELESELNRLYEFGFITESEKNAVDKSKLKKFFDSKLFERIVSSNEYKREMRFLTNIPVGKFDDEVSDDIKEEQIVLQGAVDCLFCENDEIVIVDFKTDRGKDKEELINEYKSQLDLYALAAEKILHKKVKEKVIYSFAIGDFFTV